jgi:hypothetical protein
MKKPAPSDRLGNSLSAARRKGTRRRFSRPLVEVLEDRRLLAAAAISAIQQYGVPSVFAIDSVGLISYNSVTEINGVPQFGGWNPILGVLARSISPGTVTVNQFSRPDVFAVTTSNTVEYNFQNSSGSWNGWSQVGGNVGAIAISSGTIPVANAPYVVMINSNHDVYFNYQVSSGVWAGWTPVGVGVGAAQVSTGILAVSSTPLVYEPYVFMLNAAHNVYYSIRHTNGTWGGWSSVGVGVGATSIAAVTLNNLPYVSMLNGAGGIYVNFGLTNGTWAGWSPVGAGSGSGATPATAAASIASVFNLYDFSINGFGQVYSTFGNYGTWSKWFVVSALPPGVGAKSIAATADPRMSPFAFAIGTDGNVYWIDQTGFAKWGTWMSLGAPV